MSAHYSKFALNTYCTTDYFRSQIPEDYPINRVLQKYRAFRRLPPNIRELSALAKQWTEKHHPDAIEEIKRWYDNEGYELNPATGKRMTDEEIDADWGDPDPALEELDAGDIPIPEGGFADPEAWAPDGASDGETGGDDGPDEAGIRRDIAGYGGGYVANYYGVPAEPAGTLAQRIIAARSARRRHVRPPAA